jgi:hypothetical protein
MPRNGSAKLLRQFCKENVKLRKHCSVAFGERDAKVPILRVN